MGLQIDSIGGRRRCGAASFPCSVQQTVGAPKSMIVLGATDPCEDVGRLGPGLFERVSKSEDDYGRSRAEDPQFTHLWVRLPLWECGLGDPGV